MNKHSHDDCMHDWHLDLSIPVLTSNPVQFTDRCTLCGDTCHRSGPIIRPDCDSSDDALLADTEEGTTR